MKKIIGSIAIIAVVLLGIIIFVNQNESNTEKIQSNEEINQPKKNESEQQLLNDGEKSSEEEQASEEQGSDSKFSKTQENEKTENGYIIGQQLPNEPTYIYGVLIANKNYPLPKDFNPGENQEARAAFEKMAEDAKKEGLMLVAFSTFRSFEYQEQLYNRYVQSDGKDNADRYSARPGYSEHQTGLAFDIGEVGKENLWLTEQFGETEAGKWLVNNAHKYGFILRYPKGKEDITGYMYESWHFRYVGVKMATEIKNSGITLEEYLGIS